MTPYEKFKKKCSHYGNQPKFIKDMANEYEELLKAERQKARKIVAMLGKEYKQAKREYKKEYNKTWSDDCQLDMLSEQACKLQQCFEQSKKILKDNL